MWWQKYLLLSVFWRSIFFLPIHALVFLKTITCILLFLSLQVLLYL
ncbi:hypothetical protein HMPREF1705_04744 [Acetomicrobium hydrogeniformans ATCC BAA-1850]|uniref:Uncharacterized protein n=1 Tax=Acetomicrobium hydrogeniformans ATCC BAA-1850 TaxID=592015 RepID=A0A0T5X922_9BACT|nr:hypothetical protein HMPREF1705_04744 [Acetomicrobium hydrogeniformans ATCC BAA-1850]